MNPFHPTKIVDKVKAASADNLIPMDKSRDMEKVQKAIKKVYFSFRMLIKCKFKSFSHLKILIPAA